MKWIGSLTVLIFTVLFIFLSWMTSDFSMQFFTSWSFGLVLILSFLLGVVIIPIGIYFRLIPWDKKQWTTKKIIVISVVYIFLLIFNAVLDKAWGLTESWVNYIVEAIIILLLLLF